MTVETEGAATPASDAAPVGESAETEQVKTIPELATEPEAKPETETTEKARDEADPEGDESSSEEDKPRRLSRSERMRRRMSAMATELDGLRAQLDSKAQPASDKDAVPKEADFNGDYFAYQSALNSHNARLAIRAEFQEQQQKEQSREHAKRQREATEEFFDRVEEIKARVPDFDKVVEAYHRAGGQLAPHVREELLESEKGPALTYYLAKNPGIAAELNALSPRDAAREIGRLEAQVSLPQSKKQTQAPTPFRPPPGGAAPSRDIHALAQADNLDAYIEARNKQDEAKRRR